ncbi:hypothetical protein [Yeosuana marina]|uniref:hypothetical protein n=1 Tax=Yeosuana marina TaxID=1565536 RepID=UPI0030C89A11
MKQLVLHITFIVLVLTNLNAFAQSNDLSGYRIEGDDVVFSFDKRDYKNATADNQSYRRDFDDLNIESVVVSGQFNNWSKNKWRMIKINDNVYELRKKLIDFTDEFSWEFKFVINNTFWAEPSRKDPNIVVATKYGYGLGNVYNLKMYTAYPDKNGNTTFKLKGYKDAKEVILSGTFNRWDEHLFKMEKTNEGWELTLQLKPDEYEYRFIVDGSWMADPDNKDKVVNEFGEYNSHLNIKQQTTFNLKGYADAQEVILAGSFNGWDEHQYKMRKTDEGWIYNIPLSGGKYHYKFIVDGEWIVDPNNTVKEYDDDGHINSVRMVK